MRRAGAEFLRAASCLPGFHAPAADADEQSPGEPSNRGMPVSSLSTGRIAMSIDVCASMRMRLTRMAVASLLACGAGAQAAPPQAAAVTPVGVWRGTSVCLVRRSACKDEIVVYRIARASTADSMALDGRKIVRGEEEEMGILACHFTPPNGLLTCIMPQGTWQFRVSRDSLVGELRLRNNTKFRDVRTSRSPGR